MKGFLKFCGATIVILLVAGLVMIGVGTTSGGWKNMGQLVSEVSKGKISFENGITISDKNLADLGIVIEQNAIFDIEDSDMFHKDYEIWKDDVKKTKVTDEQMEKLNLELGGCQFELKFSEDESYYVAYEGKGKSQAYTKGDELYVKVLNNNSTSLGTGENSCILYVPKGVVFDNVDLDLGAGKVNLDTLETKELKLDLGAGQVLSKGLQAEELKVSVGAGDVSLQDADLEKVKIKVGAGNCSIQGEIKDEVDAECALGNITLKLLGEEKDFDYDCDCVSGNITIAGEEYTGIAKEMKVDNDAEKKMDLECAMGNIEVEFQ